MPPTDSGSYPPAAGPYGGQPHAQPGDVGYAQPAQPSNRRTVGWIGVAALYALVIWQLLVPTVRTLTESTRSGSPFSGGSDPAGLQNWASIMPELVPALGFSILTVLPVTVAAAALGLVIGAAMTTPHRLSLVVRVVVGVLAALFAPLGIGLSRFFAGDGIGSPEQARTFVVVAITLAALPLLTAGFATAFALVLRVREPGRGVAAVLILGVTGALALGAQLFDVPYTFTGPQQATQTPMALMYRLAYMMADFGRGAAVAGALLLLAGALGVIAVVAVLLLRMRLGVEGEVAATRAPSAGLGVAGAVVAVLVLLGCLVVFLPVLTGGLSTAPDGQVTPVRVMLATWGPVAIATVLQVSVAVAAGAAIGWCQPAGRHSMWLLLPLAPWLFVGPGPLTLARFLHQRDMGTLNTWTGLIPGPTIVVGAVIVMAMLFAGMRERSRADGRVLGAAAAGLGAVLLVTQAQSLLPALIVSNDPDLATAPMTLVRMAGSLGFHNEEHAWLLGLLYPLPMLLVVAALGVLGQLGLRRAALQPPHPQQPSVHGYA